ncbi:unnamed protein product [Phyllotreta striolata]|uniref:Tetratricopeptide SHNi-TPR domain-containing protein n=1 Tax=Phyllotreta striolata TaxID=444603 RepID=A0A9P0GYJ5_PHYSR|nr:unnamed protein product [Phyllotreta striolata]
MADVVVNSDNKNWEQLYAQGVRAYVFQDYSAAAAALSQAIEIVVKQENDDLCDSLGDVYLHYGKALLELSREESDALGDAVPKNNEESSEESEAEESENAANEEKEAEVSEDSKKVEEEEVVVEAEPAATTGGPSTSNGEAEEEEEDPSDLQIAWEVLEYARKIYLNQGEAAKKNLAETLVVLGEVALESENFESAISDITEGLGIQRGLFGDDSRAVATTLYKLGIAYAADSQTDKAVGSFEESLACLANRVAALRRRDGQQDAAEEIEEIEGLMPDIREKITDMKTYKEERLKKVMSIISESSDSPRPSTSTSKPASDISHLVKRKRKLENIPEENEAEHPAKKPPSN